MNCSRISNLVRVSISAAIAILALTSTLHAQGPLPNAPIPSAMPSAALVQPEVVRQQNFETTHKFWDKQNSLLFAAVAAGNAADFAVTRANLQNGGRELNPVVQVFGRSTAGLALNFAGETAGVVGLSYFFHRTGHHKLERAVSFVNIAASAGAVSYGIVHQ